MDTGNSNYHFLQGGGEMGALTREHDWSQTPIGTPDRWPQSLRIVVSMLLTSRFPMFLWWGDDLIQFYNDAYRPSLGNEGKHPLALGQKGQECWPEIWDIIHPLIKQVRTTGEATWSEDQLVPIYRNGKIEDVYWTFGYSPIIGDTEKVEGVLVVCTETTGKINSIKKLEESERRFRNLIAESTIATAVFYGKDMIVDVANDVMLKLWNKDRSVIGKPLMEIRPELLNQRYPALLYQVFSTGEIITEEAALVHISRNGKWEAAYRDFSYKPLLNEQGEVTSILATVVDVTDKIVAQQKIEEVVATRTKELAEANRSLQKSNAELAQFAYIASHDLQEPVRKVSTFAQMLEQSLGNIDERSMKYLGKINTASSRMSTLIRDVLSYSQLSSEKDVFMPVDLQQVVQHIINDFELLIEQKNAAIGYSGLPTIHAIPLQMSQLFGNLISNALKFSRTDIKPVISISVSQLTKEEAASFVPGARTTYYNIEIRDNGIGFKQEYADQIFNIFQRLHGKSEYAGTGIGLAMCKKIAQNHQGDIYASGSTGNGAIFNVILPQHPSIDLQ